MHELLLVVMAKNSFEIPICLDDPILFWDQYFNGNPPRQASKRNPLSGSDKP
jgi:hypothetical protein